MSGMLTGWLGYFSDGWTERVAQMRGPVVFLVTLAAFVWFQSEQNDCYFRGMNTEQWLECLTR